MRDRLRSWSGSKITGQEAPQRAEQKAYHKRSGQTTMVRASSEEAKLRKKCSLTDVLTVACETHAEQPVKLDPDFDPWKP